AFESYPGLLLATAWRTPPEPTLPGDGEEPTFPDGHLVPPPGGTHLQFFQLPPDAAMAAALEENPGLVDEFMAELRVKIPDLAEAISEENPALHATASIDYVIVLSGAVVLALDDGVTVELNPGDVVVQNGTPHAWYNPGDEPARLVAVLVGTPPRSGS
ncbi:MAG: cupin domain-containing protein, partial [Gemmatimonadetes bacterium]|nr:cupin domain-containing protein [Gemmatimonadota bacterium]NIQ53290.1 cupin domain-containing protein [Gemmatimonadota bacterium]NIU73428.1 cupin domain-containing protein [Gammaproteobacteria bacterium]NIX43663.1 cupin domain-containing protein [Gemmatimonadota bacterium]NIY07854.1 cupin domain-containing protein [Gemmatimonadota bacterium]